MDFREDGKKVEKMGEKTNFAGTWLEGGEEKN